MTNKNKIKTPPEDRIYDDNDGFFLRAASVCVKDHNESEVIIRFKYVYNYRDIQVKRYYKVETN